jgi:hypothetical protein
LSSKRDPVKVPNLETTTSLIVTFTEDSPSEAYEIKVNGLVPAQIYSVSLSSFQAVSNGCKTTLMQSVSIQRIVSYSSQNAPHETGVAN